MGENGQVDVDKRIGRGKPLLGQWYAFKAVDDPSILANDIGVDFTVFLWRDPSAILHAGSVCSVRILNEINNMQREVGDLRQPTCQR